MHGVNKISLGEWAQPAKVYDLNNVGFKKHRASMEVPHGGHRQHVRASSLLW